MTTTTQQRPASAGLATLHTIATWARCHLLRGDGVGAKNILANHPHADYSTLTDEDRRALGMEVK